MAEELVLKAQVRTVLGKKVKALRRQGLTPIHLYGRGIPSMALQTDARHLRRVLARAGRHRPVILEVEEENGTARHMAFVREIQFHPLTLEVLHADFYRVELGQRVTVEVPVRLEGTAPVEAKGGRVVLAIHSVEVECPATEVPEAVSANAEALRDFGDVLRARDLTLPPGVSLRTDPEEVVAYVVGEQPEEEEAPAEAVPAEPEVIRPARQEEEEG